MQITFLELNSTDGTTAFSLMNDWVFANVNLLTHALDDVDAGNSDHVIFQCGGLDTIDIAGAWLLFR